MEMRLLHIDTGGDISIYSGCKDQRPHKKRRSKAARWETSPKLIKLPFNNLQRRTQLNPVDRLDLSIVYRQDFNNFVRHQKVNINNIINPQLVTAAGESLEFPSSLYNILQNFVPLCFLFRWIFRKISANCPSWRISFCTDTRISLYFFANGRNSLPIKRPKIRKRKRLTAPLTLLTV